MALSSDFGLGSDSLQHGLPPDTIIFGHSKVMAAVRLQIHKLASANVPVLVHGESGTGKQIIAKLIHQLSPWNSGPFVTINCPAIPGSLMESELFGHERGSFTGAYGTRPGRVEMAKRGTLFLDEIGELDLGLQAKLLQVLQDGQFCRIGAQENKQLEARVICATNRSLENEVTARTFRQDLYYRINVVNVALPPLRERRGDIPELAAHFVRLYNHHFNRNAPALKPEVTYAMQAYHWPGNVRELENLIKRYVIMGSLEVIVHDLERASADPAHFEFIGTETVSLKQLTKDAVKRMERSIIARALKTHQWNRTKAAKSLKISYRGFLYKLKEVGLQPDLDDSRSLPSGDIEALLPNQAEAEGEI